MQFLPRLRVGLLLQLSGRRESLIKSPGHFRKALCRSACSIGDAVVKSANDRGVAQRVVQSLDNGIANRAKAASNFFTQRRDAFASPRARAVPAPPR